MHRQSIAIISLLLLRANLILSYNLSNKTNETMKQELADSKYILLSNLTVDEYDYYGLEQLNDTIKLVETIEILNSKDTKEMNLSSSLPNSLSFNITISTTDNILKNKITNLTKITETTTEKTTDTTTDTNTEKTTQTTKITTSYVPVYNITLMMNQTFSKSINETSNNSFQEQQFNLTQYNNNVTFDFKLNLSSLNKVIGDLVTYYILLLICVLVLAMLFFIAICVYFKASKTYAKQCVTKSLLRRKKNFSFDAIDQGFKLNRNTDRILNRIDSNYFPILIDEAPKPLGEISEDSNENMYELPYTLETDIEASKNFKKNSDEASKRDSAQMKSFNYGNVNNIAGINCNSNKLNYIYADSDESSKTYLDDRYKDFCHRDEIYFRSSSNSNVFNPIPISQSLEYESASNLILNSSSVKNKRIEF